MTFVIPSHGVMRDKSFMRIIGMSQVPVVYRDVDYDYVNQRIGHVMDLRSIINSATISMPISRICIRMTWVV